VTEEEKTRLLFQILKSHSTGDTSAISFQLSEGDWREMYACAAYQNVEPLLFFHLKEKGLEQALPKDVHQEMQQAYHKNSARNLRLYELGQILVRLNLSRLPAIILKGAYLAAFIYPNPALRSMVDMDILMRPEDITPALEALKALGYGHMLPPWANVDFHAILSAPGCTTRLEMHWDLTTTNDNYQIPAAELCARAVAITIGGAQALALSPEDLILHLCAHTSVKHLFMQGVRSLCDIDRCVRCFSDALDWEQIITRALDWGLGRATALTLNLCKSCLDTPIPESLLNDPRFPVIDPTYVQDALIQVSSGPELIDELPPGLIQMISADKFLHKLEIFLQYVFLVPETPYQPVSEMPKLLLAYYLFRRLLFLARKYSVKLIQMMFKRLFTHNASHDRKWALLKWMQN
jgi:hypothetical protein